ncbi:uncharacterized protein BDZ99DRAFT_481201 [Mytilinidion resinicola]|uniref:Uncharacterized protein n=1 Tax=Mytilinidion resinicola TaxID=574789 RepID=A0A6A6Y6B9_9PEZI|nr:uncharacterized protein BDZ99DRAFT_481201 [Mytilinidion resinicola]KAF2804371.1 hypothetical protein BDZ99DRAFT_481201 [Mytilinidion resinicola]
MWSISEDFAKKGKDSAQQQWSDVEEFAQDVSTDRLQNLLRHFPHVYSVTVCDDVSLIRHQQDIVATPSQCREIYHKLSRKDVPLFKIGQSWDVTMRVFEHLGKGPLEIMALSLILMPQIFFHISKTDENTMTQLVKGVTTLSMSVQTCIFCGSACCRTSESMDGISLGKILAGMSCPQNLNIFGVSGLQKASNGQIVECEPLGKDPIMSSVVKSRLPGLQSFNPSRFKVNEEDLLQFYESNSILKTNLRQVVLNKRSNGGRPWLRLIEVLKAKETEASIIVLEDEIPPGYPDDYYSQHEVDDGVIKIGFEPSLGLDRLQFQLTDMLVKGRKWVELLP